MLRYEVLECESDEESKAPEGPLSHMNNFLESEVVLESLKQEPQIPVKNKQSRIPRNCRQLLSQRVFP